MSAKNERIVRYSAEELDAMIRRGEVHSDWIKAAEHPVPDGSDPDDMIEDVDPDYVTTTVPPMRRRPAA